MSDADGKLINRAITDDNFAHTLRLFPFARWWAETVELNRRLSWNDRNMIQILVELLEAFVRDKAKDHGPLADVCRDVVAQIEAFRDVTTATEGYHEGSPRNASAEFVATDIDPTQQDQP